MRLRHAHGTRMLLLLAALVLPAAASARPASSEGGLIAYIHAGQQSEPQLHVIRPDGSGDRQLTQDRSGAGVIRFGGGLLWSNDGQWLAFGSGCHSTASACKSLSLTDPAGTTRVDLDQAARPSFSPDSRFLAFLRCVSACDELVVIELPGIRRVRRTRSVATGVLQFTWLPDGRRLWFRTGSASYVVKFNGQHPLRTQALDAAVAASWSPAGDQLALEAWDGDSFGVYLARTTDYSAIGEIGDAGVWTALSWSPDGSALAYLTGTREFSAVAVSPNGGDPTLFEPRQFTTFGDWGPGGSSLLLHACDPPPGPGTPDCGFWIADLDSSKTVELPDGESFDWSPSGARLVYAAGTPRQIFTVLASGGSSTPLARRGDNFSPAWQP